MHDPERRASLVLRFVRGVEPVKHVRGDRDRDRGRDPDAAVVGCLHQPPERFTLHVVEDEEELVFGRHHVERGDHVLVANARHHARLVDEAGAELRVLRELRMKLLDRDRAGEADGAEEPAEVNRRHASCGDFAVDGVPTHRPRCAWPTRDRGGVFVDGGRHVALFSSVFARPSRARGAA